MKLVTLIILGIILSSCASTRTRTTYYDRGQQINRYGNGQGYGGAP